MMNASCGDLIKVVAKSIKEHNGYAPNPNHTYLVLSNTDFIISRIGTAMYNMWYNSDNILKVISVGQMQDISFYDGVIECIAARYTDSEILREYIRNMAVYLNNVGEYIVAMKFEQCIRERIFEQYGYRSTDEIAEEYESLGNFMISKVFIDNLYNADEVILANDMFREFFAAWFECDENDITDVYTYSPLDMYDPELEYNAYCGVDCAICRYSGKAYAAFHTVAGNYEVHEIGVETQKNMANLMKNVLYPHTTNKIVRTNLAVRRARANVERNGSLAECMARYRIKIHETHEWVYKDA